MADVGSCQRYPWHLLMRTVALLLAFLTHGVNSNLFGPTLLDLKDLVGATVGEVSFIIVTSSFGCLMGSFAVGLLMDKFTRYRYMVLASTLVVLGVFTCLLPYSPDLLSMLVISFISGFGSGAFDTGGNVQMLDIWTGRDSGPYMHSLHFIWSVGAVLAPLIAVPFLKNTAEDASLADGPGGNTSSLLIAETPLSLPAVNRSVNVVNVDEDGGSSDFWNVKTLFPLAGSASVLVASLFVFYFCRDWSKKKVNGGGGMPLSSRPADVTSPTAARGKQALGEVAVVGLLALLFFLYVGLEVAYGTFLTVFSVRSKLGLTRQEGAKLTAIFWGSFATARGLAIPAAIFLSPESIMWTSLTMALAGASVLACFGETTVIWLLAGSILMGAGMASIFATGFLWLEKRKKVTNRIAAMLCIASSLGAKFFPAVVGQTVEEFPMFYMYINLGIVIGCIGLFLILNLLTRNFVRLAQPTGDHGEKNDELMDLREKGESKGKIKPEEKEGREESQSMLGDKKVALEM